MRHIVQHVFIMSQQHLCFYHDHELTLSFLLYFQFKVAKNASLWFCSYKKILKLQLKLSFTFL